MGARLSISDSKDTDRMILMNLDDQTFMHTCKVNKFLKNKVCDDSFIVERLKKTYPNTLKYKTKDITWWRFFLNVIYYTDLLKKEYKYIYNDGDFILQYKLLKLYYPDNMNQLLIESAENGDYDLVLFTLDNIYGYPDYETIMRVLTRSSIQGFTNIFSLVFEHTRQEFIIYSNIYLENAIKNGNLKLVKYLHENGADLHYNGDEGLELSILYGEKEIEEYIRKN